MRLSTLSNAAFVRKVGQFFNDDRKDSRRWRSDAREDFEFKAGRQWSDDDLQTLEQLKRPAVTFDRINPQIDAITGSERTNRQQVRFLPRTVDTQSQAPGANDGFVSETYTVVSDAIRQNSDAEDEESDAFEDAIVSGMGWTETWIDFEDEPEGKIKIDRVPPLEMYWDRDAVKRNLADATRVYRIKTMLRDEVKEIWPKARLMGTANDFFDAQSITQEPHDADAADEYRTDQAGRVPSKDEINVVQFQWCEREPFFLVENQVGEVEELSTDEFRALESDGLTSDLLAVRRTRKTYHQAFIAGKTVLERGPLHPDSKFHIPGFTLKCITGKRDQNKKQWFGLVRAMKDPQRWANKYFSSMQEIFANSGKGGLIAEKGAFDNTRKAEEDWSKSGSILFVNNGALSGQKPRITERNNPGIPAAADRLHAIAVNAIREVSGINLEVLGLSQVTQSPGTEQSRVRQSLTTLATLFDSLRRYRKEHGRILLHMINVYVDEGTIFRIAGEDKFVQFQKDPNIIKYDIIVDQSPTSPNMKMEVWNSLQPVLPVLIEQGAFPPALLDYLPVPASVIAKIKQHFDSQQPTPEQVQLQEQAQQLQVQKLQSEVQLDEARAQAELAKAFSNMDARQLDRIKVALEAREMELEDRRERDLSTSQQGIDLLTELVKQDGRANGSADRTA